MVTGTRAEFGLLKGLMELIQDSADLDLQVVVTGTHLVPEFGFTVREITESGFQVAHEVNSITFAETGADVARQVGAGTVEFTDAFTSLESEVIVLLGDRYEMLAAGIAAFFLGVPVVHIHGGELTHGAFDDTIRHTLSKLSSVHCVAHDEYAARVIQLGEQPDSVHVVGALGVDQLSTTTLKSRGEIEKILGIQLSDPVFLVTYHPVTRGTSNPVAEISALVAALEEFPQSTVIVTMPNADPDHQLIAPVLRDSVQRHSDRWVFVNSLGAENYLSLMALASAVVGNSSSGVLEAPSFQTATINIGSRQEGRILASSVVSCKPTKSSILGAIQEALSPVFRETLLTVTNPLGGPGAAKRILQLIESISATSAPTKVFYDQRVDLGKWAHVS